MTGGSAGVGRGVVWATAVATFAFAGLGNAAWSWTDTPAPTVVAFRFLLGGTLAAAVHAAVGRRREPKAVSVAARRAMWAFVALEGSAVAVLAVAVREAPPALVTALAGAVPPLLALLRPSPPSPRVWAALFILAGAVAGWAASAMGDGAVTVSGLALAVLFVSLAAGGTVASVRARAEVPALAMVTRLLVTAGAAGGVWLTVTGAWAEITSVDVAVAGFLAVVPGGVGKVSTAWVAGHLDPAALQAAGQVAVVTSAAGAWAAGGSRPSLVEGMLAAVVCVSVVLLARWDRPPAAAYVVHE